MDGSEAPYAVALQMLLVHWLDRCLSCCLLLRVTVGLASVSDFRRSTSRELFSKTLPFGAKGKRLSYHLANERMKA
jgi:hypothetical protein